MKADIAKQIRDLEISSVSRIGELCEWFITLMRENNIPQFDDEGMCTAEYEMYLEYFHSVVGYHIYNLLSGLEGNIPHE